MRRLFLLSLLLLFVSGCSIFGRKKYDQQLMSPCASTHSGPCKHIPVNTWLGEVVYQI